MKFWWVNQKKTYKHEVPGGYLWSPTKNINGGTNHYYDNMTRVAVGDVVFSYANGAIKAVGMIASLARSAPQPTEFGAAGAGWGKNGWLVDVDFTELSSPVDPKKYLKELSAHIGKAGDPLRSTGHGKEFYLSSIDQAMAATLGSIIGPEYQATLLDAQAESALLRSSLGAAPSQSTQTERTQVGKARVGQGVFKARVRRQEPHCRVTGVHHIAHLRASHIKPWAASSDVERLDGDNGLLLAPHIDHLFDEGFITFSARGKLMRSKRLHPSVTLAWTVVQAVAARPLTAAQEVYMAYHRTVVFKG